jgi:hypothetical protein
MGFGHDMRAFPTETSDTPRDIPKRTFVMGYFWPFFSFSINGLWPFTVTTSPFGFFGFVAFCTCIFFVYDFLMRHEAQQNHNILEMKRRFVRFISHEIRTPLNTVCMGLELLESELKMAPPNKDNDRGEGVEKEGLDFWSNVTNDIKENTHTAVEILNDMLNYDNLESGGLNLELTQVRISDIVERTVHQSQVEH